MTTITPSLIGPQGLRQMLEMSALMGDLPIVILWQEREDIN